MRITWELYALKLAKIASERSEDVFLKTGCCLLRFDKSVASLGYNGAPPGIEIDWSNRDERRKRVIHAENNAVRYVKPGEVWLAATFPISPCQHCVQILAAYGVKKIVYSEVYNQDNFGLELAKEFGVELLQITL